MEKQMKKIDIFLVITIVAGTILGQSSGAIPGFRQNTGRSNLVETKKQTFIVIYKPGPAWLVGKPLSEQPLKERGKYMLSMVVLQKQAACFR
jgi:hypothetical protein